MRTKIAYWSIKEVFGGFHSRITEFKCEILCIFVDFSSEPLDGTAHQCLIVGEKTTVFGGKSRENCGKVRNVKFVTEIGLYMCIKINHSDISLD